MEVKVYQGKPDPKAYDKEFLLNLYGTMLKARILDQNICRLIAEGSVKGFYHAGLGQEAIGIGTISQLREDDYIFYMHRGCTEMVAKGVPLEGIYGDFFATLAGTNKGLGAGIVHSACPEKGVLGQPGTIGSNTTLAAGVGYGIRYLEQDKVVVCFFGDGTAARETISGALNWAGLWKLPVIFVCENNEYGLSNYFMKANAVKEYIAERAASYNNVDAVVVDGNDVLAVSEVMKAAVEKARSGEGATFIEAKSFRYRGHFEGDPCVYMDKERRDWFMNENDPIDNLAKRILEAGIASQEELDQIENRLKEEDAKALEIGRSAPLPTKERLYEGLFSEGKEVFQCRK